jgi:hypothetical protein
MRRVLALVLLMSGCNWIYGLADTRPAPAIDIDADLFSCATIPTFTTPPRLAGTGISSFAIDVDGLLQVGVRAEDGAVCQADSSSQLAPSSFTDPTSTTHTRPRLAPAGTEMFVLTNDETSLDTYLASATDTWNFETTNLFPMSITTATWFSEPTKGAMQRHMIVLTKGEFFEYAEEAVGTVSATPWSLVPQNSTYAPTALGVEAMTEPSMSADGQRLVFRGTNGGHDDVYITTRASLDDVFPTAQLLYATPDDQTELTPFMTADCGRLYFTLGSDLYYVTY